MKIVQMDTGHVVAIGFDMKNVLPNPRMVSWRMVGEVNSPLDFNIVGYDLMPEFVRTEGNRLLSYQPGRMMEMTFVGEPFGFAFHHFKAERE